MRNPNRKSFSMSPGSKSGFGKSSPRPASRPSPKPSIGVSRGAKEGFGRPVSPPRPIFRPTPRVYPPGYRRPFYRRPATIVSTVVFVLACLVCLAIAAVFWIVPSLMNGTLRF